MVLCFSGASVSTPDTGVRTVKGINRLLRHPGRGRPRWAAILLVLYNGVGQRAGWKGVGGGHGRGATGSGRKGVGTLLRISFPDRFNFRHDTDADTRHTTPSQATSPHANLPTLRLDLFISADGGIVVVDGSTLCYKSELKH